MPNLIYLFFRRMRAPLVVLIAAYTISIGGLVLLPGVDDQGNPWRFNFFHAFYFVSFMGSTIGFGEIPYAFSDAQRMWTTMAMYLTVIAWLYAIGNILALVQDPAFKRAVTEQRFTRSVRRLKVPFYVICGYGDTGSLLVRALNRREIQSVVIDNDPECISALALEDLHFDVPSLCANVRDVLHLIEAGLQHPKCVGVVALTDADDINVKVAVTCKLLNPSVKVICRAESQEAAANMASFNTDHIINPFETFADHLAMGLRTPSANMFYEWLVSRPNQPMRPIIRPPRGKWIVCSFGRFGKAVHRYLHYEGIPMAVIHSRADDVPQGAVIGRGTEAVTLREAGIQDAVGIVAGTDTDADNLSIIVTARQLNPNLYLVGRQNRRRNTAIFKAAQVDLVMESSRIIVWRILPLLTNPVLNRFLSLARHRKEDWGKEVLGKICALTDNLTPETWQIEIEEEQTPAVHAALCQGRAVKLGHLMHEPQDRAVPLPCLPLLLLRTKEEVLMPEAEHSLQLGDKVLFCGTPGTLGRMSWITFNPNVLEYIQTGNERPDGYIWRWLSRRRGQAAARQG